MIDNARQKQGKSDSPINVSFHIVPFLEVISLNNGKFHSRFNVIIPLLLIFAICLNLSVPAFAMNAEQDVYFSATPAELENELMYHDPDTLALGIDDVIVGTALATGGIELAKYFLAPAVSSLGEKFASWVDGIFGSNNSADDFARNYGNYADEVRNHRGGFGGSEKVSSDDLNRYYLTGWVYGTNCKADSPYNPSPYVVKITECNTNLLYLSAYISGMKYTNSADASNYTASAANVYAYVDFVAPISGKVYLYSPDSSRNWAYSSNIHIYGEDSNGNLPEPCFKSPMGSLAATSLSKVDSHEGTKLSSALAFSVSKGVKYRIMFYLTIPSGGVGGSAVAKSNVYLTFDGSTSEMFGNDGVCADYTRPGTWPMQYAKHNSDNTYNTWNNNIVNETNNTYYSPTENTYYDLRSWSYDYSSRTYTLVRNDNSQTVTVKYGDQYITINEGGTTNNYYYYLTKEQAEAAGITSGSASCPGNDSGVHNWEQTALVAASCRAAGKRTLTCSYCGQTKTESVPATGHSWSVVKSQATEYDDDGNLLHSAYTLYQCDSCGEMYKDSDGSGPPATGGSDDDSSNSGSGTFGKIFEKLGEIFGSIGGGILEAIGGFFLKILDAFASLLDAALQRIDGIVDSISSLFSTLPNLAGGFFDMLGAVFGWLPSECLVLLELTFILLVVAVILRFRR